MRLTALALLAPVVACFSDEVKLIKWSGKLNVPDPTSITFDEAGNAYVASTTRRKAADLDIREHTLWIPYDVALTSPTEKLAFYQRELATGIMKTGRGNLKDHNKDGSVDWKDLTFHKERIYKLTDADRDGIADKMTIFAEGFNSPVSGIAAGVLYFDGWVYLTAIPDLWRLKDTDGDGIADIKEIIATGFGGHIAYAGHDMHGLRLGPDGRIYWTVGDKGGNVLSMEGIRHYFPHEGALLRCEPDGTGLEIVARGIRNTQEIAFDTFGNIIGVDNDGDQPKERERLMYLIEGSDSGWRNQHQYQKTQSRWIKENMWMPSGAPDQPYSILPPIANYSNGPAGFLFEPGHALDNNLRGHFILNQFPNGKMDAFSLVSDNDTFKQQNLRTINDGIMGIGMTWAPDGRAFFADWIGGYPLDGKGAIWGMEVASKIDPSSESILSKPFSIHIPKDKLLTLLGHRDQRVRINASLRLDRLSAWSDMMNVAIDSKSGRLARIHAIWGWGMGLRHGRLSTLAGASELLKDSDDEIRVQTLKVLSEGRLPPSTRMTLESEINDREANLILLQLESANPRLKMQAALTLGRLGIGRVPSWLVTKPTIMAFLKNASTDLRMPWLRHGIVCGLSGTQSSESLLAFAQANSGAEAIFATLALVRQKSPLLSKLLSHKNPTVVTEAARAIHDDEGIPSAETFLAEIFGQNSLPFHAARRSLNANLRQGDEIALQRILSWTVAQNEGTPLRSEALNALLVFDQPPTLDIIDGTARRYPTRNLARIKSLVCSYQNDFLRIIHPNERALALGLLVKYEADLPFSVLASLTEDINATPAVRIQTLRLLSRRSNESAAITQTLLKTAGDGNPSELRIEALNQLFLRNPEAAIDASRLIIKSKQSKLPEKQAVIQALLNRSELSAVNLLRELVSQLVKGEIDSGIKLDVFEFARNSTDSFISEGIKNYLSESAKNGLKFAATELPYELLFEGGNVLRGKDIVNGHLAANCTACHSIESDEGSEVGPKLSNIGGLRSKEEIAESIISPSSQIVSGYGLETIQLQGNILVVGAVIKELPKSLELRLADGTKQLISKSLIESRMPPVSIMPPMLGVLTPSEIRDVIAYLSKLKVKTRTPKTTK